MHSQFTAFRTWTRHYTGTGPTCTKLVRMWNRLCILHETTWCDDVVVYGAKNSAVRCETGLSQHRQSNKIKTNGRCFTVVSTIAECWHIKFWHVSCVQYVENRQQLVKSSANHRVEAGWTPMVSPRYTATQFHSLWCDPVGGHVGVRLCVRSHVGCGTVWQTCLTNISKMQKRCKYTEFFNKVKFDLEGQAQSAPKTIGTLSKMFCILWSKFGDSSLNLWRVIAQTSSWLTDTRTHAGNDNTRRPELASGNISQGFNVMATIKHI